MKKKLSFRELTAVGSMLFGLFFGAGNLIFPAAMGQLAGRNVFIAAAGLCITRRGSSPAGRGGPWHQPLQRTCPSLAAGWKTIRPFLHLRSLSDHRPFFCHPPLRNRTLYGRDLPPFCLPGTNPPRWLFFSLLFFAAVLWFSLRPGNILTWIGKILNPLFLICLGILLVRRQCPSGHVASIAPEGGYVRQAFMSGFLARV